MPPNTNTHPLFARKGVMKQLFLPINQVMELKWLTWAWLRHVLGTPVHGHEDGLINGDINLGHCSKILFCISARPCESHYKDVFSFLFLIESLLKTNPAVLSLLVKLHSVHKTWFLLTSSRSVWQIFTLSMLTGSTVDIVIAGVNITSVCVWKVIHVDRNGLNDTLWQLYYVDFSHGFLSCGNNRQQVHKRRKKIDGGGGCGSIRMFCKLQHVLLLAWHAVIFYTEDIYFMWVPDLLWK